MTDTSTVHVKKNTKTEYLEDPTYAIFLESRGFKDFKYHSLSSQPVNFVGQPDQTREDFNLANLILELAFLFYPHPP